MQVTSLKNQSQINLFRLRSAGLVFWNYKAILVFRTSMALHSLLIFTCSIILYITPILETITKMSLSEEE